MASYEGSCAFGGTSIWSLGVERNTGPRRRVLTIEVANRKKVISQVRGKANRLSNQHEMDLIRRWAMQEQLIVAGHVSA